jgi:hypothetical protein
MVVMGALRIRCYVNPFNENLTSVDITVAILKVDFAFPDGLYLGSGEYDTGKVFIDDLVFESSLPVAYIDIV